MAKNLISVRIDGEVLAKLDAVAAERGISKSQAINDMLSEAPPLSIGGIRAKVAGIAERYPFVRTMTLFGSYARGEARSDSDVDLAFTTGGASYDYMSEDGLGGLIEELKESLGVDVDAIDSEYLEKYDASSPLLASIRRDGVPVYGR